MISLSNFQWRQNIALYFETLKADESHDVTLITEDNKVVSCHKIVLQIGSLFFRNIFKLKQMKNNPIVYLRGLDTECLENILEFLYTGQVKVPRIILENFIKISNDLQIIGLYAEKEQSLTQSVPLLENEGNTPNINKKCEALYMNMSGVSSLDSANTRPDKDVTTGNDSSGVYEQLEEGASSDNVYSSIDNADVSDNCPLMKNTQNLTCELCDKTFKNKQHFKLHCYKMHTGDKFLQKSLIALT